MKGRKFAYPCISILGSTFGKQTHLGIFMEATIFKHPEKRVQFCMAMFTGRKMVVNHC